MKQLALMLLLAQLVWPWGSLAGAAQPNVVTLNARLQEAVAQQQWHQAIQIVDQLLQVSPNQRTALQAYRTRLVSLQQSGYRRPTPPPTQALVNAQGVRQVPIKRRLGGTAVIDVKFNHRLVTEMMVDSGASLTVLTRATAQALGITPAHIVDRIVVSTANGPTELPIVYVNAIEIAGLRRSQIPVAVGGPTLDIGLLGQDFLAHYDVSLRQESIEFHPR
ncbi:TIGR02281 family clan AA aspartic protease [Synechococcales cyanobacterium C]|uniref:TIGR02281 family clan AA aspartic protease n=1 Tax=Petrachloros mirabilis ULC683 TaxID=2781853 RepID=A0A8K1ZX72_9CYAN|nr:retropepsin-like aspartic protease [Petrachloros mirabilis]NCJ05761.1 TIGR02281 family clan AA aspartic protease [Petrachloros mirabilis ULC683]